MKILWPTFNTTLRERSDLHRNDLGYFMALQNFNTGSRSIEYYLCSAIVLLWSSDDYQLLKVLPLFLEFFLHSYKEVITDIQTTNIGWKIQGESNFFFGVNYVAMSRNEKNMIQWKVSL